MEEGRSLMIQNLLMGCLSQSSNSEVMTHRTMRVKTCRGKDMMTSESNTQPELASPCSGGGGINILCENFNSKLFPLMLDKCKH